MGLDKATYKQIDRIEDKIDHLKAGIGVLMQLEANDVIKQFYEAEVLEAEGQLHHLKDDKVLYSFINNLDEDEDDGHKNTSQNSPKPQSKTEEEYTQPN